MGLTRDKIRAHERRTEQHHIEALGDTVILRMFSAAQRAELRGRINRAAEATDAEDRARRHQDITAKVVQLTLTGSDGQLLYSADEVDTLQDEMDPAALDEIADKAMLFTRMATAADAESPEKKSSGNRTDADSSGSA